MFGARIRGVVYYSAEGKINEAQEVKKKIARSQRLILSSTVATQVLVMEA